VTYGAAFAFLGISQSAASAGETSPSWSFVFNIIQKSCVVCVPGHLRVQMRLMKSRIPVRECENKVLLFVVVRENMIFELASFCLHNERNYFKNFLYRLEMPETDFIWLWI
jgi:hypothetical protein